jgi:hypothetical protein
MRLAATLLLLLSVPASASLTRYSWNGETDAGQSVSGHFTFDDSAPIISEELGGYTVRGGAISRLDLIMGPDTFTRYNQPWDALMKPSGDVTFQDANLSDEAETENSLSWNPEHWNFSVWNPDVSELREVGGRVISFYTQGGYVPDLPGRDAEPVPEPSSLLLVASGLAAYAFFRRRGRTPSPR